MFLMFMLIVGIIIWVLLFAIPLFKNLTVLSFNKTRKRKPNKATTITLKDACTIIINKTDLTSMKVGENLKMDERLLPSANGLKWWIKCYPTGFEEKSEKYISLYLFTNAPNFKCIYKVKDSFIQYECSRDHSDTLGWGCKKFASHDRIKSYFKDDKLTITCDVEFTLSVPSLSTPRLFEYCDHVPTDLDIFVGSERLQVHKSILSLISPVFYAKLSESESGELEITDFDFNTVKAAIDFIYGRELVKVSVDTTVGILRFAHKYNIQSITKHLEQQYLHFMCLDDFCAVVNYAWDCSREDLKKSCAKFYKDNKEKVTNMKGFFDFTPEVIHELVKLGIKD